MIEKKFGKLKTDDTVFCDANRNYYIITEMLNDVKYLVDDVYLIEDYTNGQKLRKIKNEKQIKKTIND